jgi:hypothetical protein
MLEGEADGRAHASGGTSAYRVHDDHGGSRLRNGTVDLGCGARFFDTETGQFLAHWNNHDFWIHSLAPLERYEVLV